MSIYHPAEQPCPECGALVRYRAYESLNGDRSPKLRQAILDNTFQEETCGACGVSFRLEPELVYFDEELGLWVRVLPLEAQGDWPAAEADTRAVFVQTYGPFAPDPVQALGARLRKRVCFGWAGLREKLVCAQAGIDDATLEVAKAAMLASGQGDNADDEAELRLAVVNEDALEFVWLMGPMEVPMEGLVVPRALLDDIEGAPEAWAATREAVSGEFFVDMNRALMGEAAA